MRRLSSNTAVKPQATSDSSAPPLSATLPHRRDRAGATEYDAYEYAALPVNVPKPGILLCTNGFDADPALSRTGTTTIAVAIDTGAHRAISAGEIKKRLRANGHRFSAL